MSTAITRAFEIWQAHQILNNLPARPDTVIFAHVPGLNNNDEIDRDEGIPDAALIVYQTPVAQYGVINDSAVAYSVVLDTRVGDFSFNWIGLVDSASNTLCMIVHTALQEKIASAGGVQGNNITRTFMMEFDGAAESSQITVTAETWQIDFSARLRGIDEITRLANFDYYGPAAFFDNGFFVAKDADKYNVSAGLAYIGGIRALLVEDKQLNANEGDIIYADVSLQGSALGEYQSIIRIGAEPDSGNLIDYRDQNGFMHYVAILARIASGEIEDTRTTSPLELIIDGFNTSLKTLVKKLELSSENVEEGDALITVKQPFAGSVPKTQHNKNRELLTPDDFSSFDDAFLAAVSNNLWLHNSDHVFSISVGPDGMFSSFSVAVAAACKMRPTWKNGNSFCEIKLKSGFVFSEQMEFKGGEDLSWIKVTSEDAIVYCDSLGFTESVKTYYDYKYLFYFHDAIKSPVFSVQLEENRDNSDVVAFVVTAGSKLSFIAGSGARKFKGGVHASYGSDVIGLHTGISTAPTGGYYLCDFSDCITFALSAMLNCRVHLPYSKFDNIAGEYAVHCIWSTVAEFRYSTANDCINGIGWYIRDGSVVSIRECQAKNCDIGIKGYHGVIINARCHDTLDDNGIIANPALFAGVSGCRTAGIYMDGACIVEASAMDMRNCGTAIILYRGCTVVSQSSCIDGCSVGFLLSTECSLSCSRMSALNVNQLLNIQNNCSVTSWLSNIVCENSTSGRYLDIKLSSRVSIFNSVLKTNAPIMAEHSSYFDFTTGTLGALRVSAYVGSRASLDDMTYDSTYISHDTPILNVQRGGVINAVGQMQSNGSNLTTNVTSLTLTKSGIIFY